MMESVDGDEEVVPGNEFARLAEDAEIKKFGSVRGPVYDVMRSRSMSMSMFDAKD